MVCKYWASHYQAKCDDKENNSFYNIYINSYFFLFNFF